MSDARAIPWDHFSGDPRDSVTARLRASDADRNVALDVLANAYADGRVDRVEHDERSSALTAAKTLGDLVDPIRDLAPDRTPVRAPGLSAPADLQAKAEDKYAQIRAGAIATFFGPSLVCWVIWAVAGLGFPWPVFVSIGVFARLAQVLIRKREIIAEQRDEIEKNERRAVERGPH